MKSTIFIPKRIKVGFNKRDDTYTGKLGYAIYYDEKGVLRKEKSWESWREKDIEPIELDNIPMEGFVLNKKVGDYNSGWGNHRSAYTRIYHPNGGWEFEITIENLLYILEHCTSTKGKGLEGEFVLGWDSTRLVLIPVDSPDYQELTKYSSILQENFKLGARTIKIGATYLNKNNEELTYIGKFDYYTHDWDRVYLPNGEYGYKHHKEKQKSYYFCGVNNDGKRYFTTEKNLNKFIAILDEECHEDYAEMYEYIESRSCFSPPNFESVEYIPYTFEEFEQTMADYYENTTYNWVTGYFDSDVLGKLQRVEFKGGGTSRDVKPYLRLEVPITETYTPYWSRTEQTRTIHVDYEVHFKNLRELFDTYKPKYQVLYLENGKQWTISKPERY